MYHRQKFKSCIRPWVYLWYHCIFYAPNTYNWLAQDRITTRTLATCATFPIFLVLIIFFIFLTSALYPFDSSTPYISIKHFFGHPALISLNNVSRTTINNKGHLLTLNPNPTSTKELSLKEPFTLIPPHVFTYIDSTILTNHPSTSSFHKAHYTPSFGTRSYTFSKSTNAKSKSFLFAKYFSCNCLKIEKSPAVQSPGMKTNCISPMPTYGLINCSITPSSIF